MGTEDFPYTIYLHQNKAVIIAHIPDQTNENLATESASEKVTIRSKDGTHCIKVPLETYYKPIIVEKTYKYGILKVTVESGYDSSTHAIAYVVGHEPKTTPQ